MKEAYALIYRTVVLQATTLAYVDFFLLLAVIASNHVCTFLCVEEK